MLSYNAKIFTTQGLVAIGELYDQGATQTKCIVDKRFAKEGNVKLSTGVLRGKKVAMYDVTTRRGLTFRCDANQKITVLRPIGKDIRGNNIVSYVDLPLKELRCGEALMMYDQAKGKLAKTPFPTKIQANDRHLGIAMAHILLYPERFLSINESTGELELVFDTVRRGKIFSVIDLNNLRNFSRVLSKYINDNELMMMQHLHYFSYKSHLGNIVYDLGWLLKILQDHKNFDITNLYSPEHLRDFHKLPKREFSTMLRKIMGFCFAAQGAISQSVRLFHESEMFLQELQCKLLSAGVVSSLKKKSCAGVFGKWRKDHPEGYMRMIKRKAYNNLLRLDEVFVYTLDIDKFYIDRFMDLGSKVNDLQSDLRNYKYAKLINQARRQESKGRHWDKIISIEATEPEFGYFLNVPDGHRLCVNGLVVHD